jgi:hypothetical protein
MIACKAVTFVWVAFVLKTLGLWRSPVRRDIGRAQQKQLFEKGTQEKREARKGRGEKRRWLASGLTFRRDFSA